MIKLQDVWDITEEPIYLSIENDISFIGSNILSHFGKRNVKKIYTTDLGITLVLEDEEDD